MKNVVMHVTFSESQSFPIARTQAPGRSPLWQESFSCYEGEMNSVTGREIAREKPKFM